MTFRTFTLLLLMLLTSHISAQDITNPVWRGNWPDPTVWLGEDGRYHCLATNPTRSLVSDDLFHWEMSDVAPIDIASWGKMQAISRNFWAPDVATVAGKRNLYLTLYNSAEDSSIGVFQEFAPSQFQFVGIITSSTETGIHDTIDPEVVTDPKTGKVWLFFGSVGGIHRIELNKDGLSLKEGATYEHVAGLKIEQNHSRSKVFEGSYLHRHDGYWYLFVSSGFFGGFFLFRFLLLLFRFFFLPFTELIHDADIFSEYLYAQKLLGRIGSNYLERPQKPAESYSRV